MSYSVTYSNCRICGCDMPKFLGTRGNLEYFRAPELAPGQEHMVTNIARCRRCGFVYANPLIEIAPEVRMRFYNQPAEYHSAVCEAGAINLFNRSLNIIEKFVKQKGKLLDIGSGKGEFLAQAKARGWEAFGLEPSVNFARWAREKLSLDIRNSTLEEANFPENSFDAITLNMTLEHIDDPHSLIAAIYRILKKTGILYIEVPNMDSMLLKLIRFYFWLRRRDWSPHISPLHYPYHCYGYGRSTLKLLCEMNKFAIRRTFIFGIGWRGFRPSAAGNKLAEEARDILAKVFGLLNQGDILIAVATKE